MNESFYVTSVPTNRKITSCAFREGLDFSVLAVGMEPMIIVLIRPPNYFDNADKDMGEAGT